MQMLSKKHRNHRLLTRMLMLDKIGLVAPKMLKQKLTLRLRLTLNLVSTSEKLMLKHLEVSIK